MTNNPSTNIGDVIKQQRNSVSLTLQELANKTGISASHLGRIERSQRFPSARMLKKIAVPLGFEENELFALAGYLSQPSPSIAENGQPYTGYRLDPLVAKLLSQEPPEVQRHVISILNILKSLSKSYNDNYYNNRK